MHLSIQKQGSSLWHPLTQPCAIYNGRDRTGIAWRSAQNRGSAFKADRLVPDRVDEPHTAGSRRRRVETFYWIAYMCGIAFMPDSGRNIGGEDADDSACGGPH